MKKELTKKIIFYLAFAKSKLIVNIKAHKEAIDEINTIIDELERWSENGYIKLYHFLLK